MSNRGSQSNAFDVRVKKGLQGATGRGGKEDEAGVIETETAGLVRKSVESKVSIQAELKVPQIE